MTKEVIVKQILVDDKPGLYRIWEIRSYTEHDGCQCFKDCTCAEDFIPSHMHYYKCTKLKNKIKTFYGKTQKACYDELKQRNVI